jgi:hypothetical protein
MPETLIPEGTAEPLTDLRVGCVQALSISAIERQRLGKVVSKVRLGNAVHSVTEGKEAR